MEPLVTTNLPGIKPFGRGKVRDTYDLGDKLLIVATDRISAFDCILPTGIPGKGKVLTQLSAFWFGLTRSIVPNHLLTTDPAGYPPELQQFSEILWGRSMLVKKAQRIDVECVVRGYLAGSAWSEYRERGMVCGMKLPGGLRESERLPEPIFTPATKADDGHDMNISVEEMAELVGWALTEEVMEKSLAVYRFADACASERAIILADTKMEFGLVDGGVILIDELLTPDSSRFWDAKDYQVGRSRASFDKQFVRDWLQASGWNKEPPAPELPADIVKRTMEKYREVYRRFTGEF
ncbi:MAG: phosphoribosylaminoimidazolesuccinocarboxamide synthase [Chloroflexi bacterium]|nr:phosphoribosylaminoimidazolesuccinocarboxamide synthase [Chloroflexota bacterium]